MENIQRIAVEIDGEAPFEYIIAKQGEANSRIVEVELLEKSTAYIIPSGTKAMIKYRKPDGKQILNDCTYTGNIVTVIYTEQMLASYGTGKGEIMLVNGSEIIKSATFYTKVVPTVYQENGLISDNEFHSLAGVLIKMEETLEKTDSAVTGAGQAVQETKELKKGCEKATERAGQAAEECNTAKEAMLRECAEAVENANAVIEETEEASIRAEQAAEQCNTAKEAMLKECAEAADNAATATEETVEASIRAEQAAEQCNDIIDGLTPRIGNNGNWYVGKEDTGVKASGGITVHDGFDSESTTDAASARTVKVIAEAVKKNTEDIDAHTHLYAGSSSIGGSADSAIKLTSSAGSVTQPVYFKDGKPTVCGHTLEASVPEGAKFTDTTYSNMSAATAKTAGKAGLVPAPAAGKQGAFLRGDGTWVVPTDSLASSDNSIPLSAKAGKSLKDSMDTINSNLFKNIILYTHNEYNKWSGAINVSNYLLFNICAYRKTDGPTVTGMMIGKAAAYGSSALPIFIYENNIVVAQFYINSNNNLFLFSRVEEYGVRVYV